ncbi:MAG: transporter substrate-binding domain-containing protein [Aquabacterium sp.]|uniref:substrate-binding periplasmic protein n=1 Tax=Aquabacterium sp. TaxID=1872578 RepID=UPI0025C2D83A|nr:transporter substrate-binding domain-containing protein [Aquabacterium sp.]MBI5925387.1 transporter substrate-binding domain-containing protein [Aquabacterium sp.]
MAIRATWSVLAVCAGLWTTAMATEVVTVAAEDDWAPYSSMRADRTGPEGLSPALVKAAFKTQDVEVRFQVVPFSRCLHYAEKGTVVGCFDTTRTETNKDLFYWHPTPLFQEELGIFARSEVNARDMKQKDLEGQAVGITIGYTYPTDFMQNPRIKKLSAVSDGNLVKMLVAKRVNYILLNTMPGYYRIKQEPALKGQIKRVGAIGMDRFWVSFSRAHPDGKRLSEVFEKGLQAIKANGEYDRMLTAFKQELQP